MKAVQKWCQWCDKEHVEDYMCREALSALKDLANMGDRARPPRHYAPGATLEDLGIDPNTIEAITGISFHGGAVQIDGEWQALLIVQTEKPEGGNYPARILVCPVDGFERLVEWTGTVFSETLASTKKLNEEGQ